MKPAFFKRPADFRRWLEANHATENELLVGFHKKDSGKPSITWPESVDQALCFGWIDGIRRSLDADSYTIRFTPRRARSIWSAVNIRRAQELIDQRQMKPAGLKAFAARQEYRSGIYSYEQRSADLPDQYRKIMQKNKTALSYYEAQPPSYRKTVNWWILCAKKEETRLKRLNELIDHCAHERRLPQLERLKKSS